MKRLYHAIRSGNVLNRQRVLAYARLFIVFEVLAGAFLTAGTYGLIVPMSQETSTDFVSFYAAGYIANSPDPAQIYDRKTHEAAENTVKHAKGLPYNYFFYPPIFLLLCTLLARLPYLLSYGVFELGTAGIYAFSVKKIVGNKVSLLPFIAFPAVGWNLGLGQNGLLTAGLLAAGTYLVDEQPLIAGICFGLLSYKPHFGLLIPVALIAGRRWRCFMAAAATTLLLVALSTLCFGTDVWRHYIDTVLLAQQTFEQGKVAFAGLVSPFAATRLLGGGIAAAYSIQLVSCALMVAITAYVWNQDFSQALRGATLTAAIILSVPVILFYDLLIAAVSIAWMVRLGLQTGFRPWEKTVFCLVGLTGFLSRGFSLSFSAPIAPIAITLLLATILRRVREERSLRQDPGAPSSLDTSLTNFP